MVQRLALITYKSKSPTETEALQEASKVLIELEPETSNDTETLGLWGAIHKRLWQITEKKKYLDVAIRAYERGFYLRNDYYNGINFAFLLNERASMLKDLAWKITDYMQARRVREEVLKICEKWLEDNPEPENSKVSNTSINDYRSNRYWVEATVGEAHLGLDEQEKAKAILKEAYEKAPQKWMQESTETQIQKLQQLLSDSPLRFISNSK